MATTIVVDLPTLARIRTAHEDLAMRAHEMNAAAKGANLTVSSGLLLNVITPHYANARAATRASLAVITTLEGQTAQALSDYETAVTSYETEVSDLLKNLQHQVELVGAPTPQIALAPQAVPTPAPYGGDVGDEPAPPVTGTHSVAPDPAPVEPLAYSEMPSSDALQEPLDDTAGREAYLEQLQQDADVGCWQQASAHDALGRSPEEMRAAFENREAITYADLVQDGDLSYPQMNPAIVDDAASRPASLSAITFR
jgi:hypothetical protein